MTKLKLKFYKFYYKNSHNAHNMCYCNNMYAQSSNDNSKEKYIFSHLIWSKLTEVNHVVLIISYLNSKKRLFQGINCEFCKKWKVFSAKRSNRFQEE